MKEYYIHPAQLSAAVQESKDLSCMSDSLADALLLIEDHVIQFPRFCKYPSMVKDEMLSYDRYRWARTGWKSIRLDGNLFSYITSGVTMNFLQTLQRYYGEQRKFQDWLHAEMKKLGLRWRGKDREDVEEEEREDR